MQHPRNERYQLVASARFQVTVRTAVIEQARRTNVIRIKPIGFNAEKSPRILVPYSMALLLYDSAKGHLEPPLYVGQDMLMTHARKVCTYLQRKRIWVRVQQVRLDGDRDMWSHEMIGLVEEGQSNE